MNKVLRTVATPLSLITMLGIGITGLMMFFGVKGPLNDIHEWLGIAFILVVLLHVSRNWRSFLFMLKPWQSKAVIGVVGAVLIALVATHLPDGQNGKGRKGPFLVLNKLSQAPIALSAPALGLSTDDAIAKLKAKGLTVKSRDQSLSQIAHDGDVEIVRLFAILVNDH